MKRYGELVPVICAPLVISTATAPSTNSCILPLDSLKIIECQTPSDTVLFEVAAMVPTVSPPARTSPIYISVILSWNSLFGSVKPKFNVLFSFIIDPDTYHAMNTCCVHIMVYLGIIYYLSIRKLQGEDCLHIEQKSRLSCSP